MSITSQSAGTQKPKVHVSPSAIAQYNRRRYYGDFGTQPNVPSVGIKMDSGASESAMYASKAQLGPKLWYPTSHKHAQRASTLASSSSSSFIPEAHFVEDPQTQILASKAATSSMSLSGEEYGARMQPEAYQWGKKPTQWAHLGATRSAAAARRDEAKATGIDALNRPPPEHAMDISKILVAAQQNADARIAAADNHLPADFGVRTEEEKYQRRQQVLSLISVADQRVKTRMAELDRDLNAQNNVFGSIEFQKLAMDIAAKTSSGRMENHGKRDLGGGLFMSQDEIDDIARRHVQPVLDKVQLIAEKKRIADREAAERQAHIQQLQAEEREAAKRGRADAKRRESEDKAKVRSQQAAAKAKAQRAAQRAKENPEPGTHLWHWQQVDIIKEDVKDAKQQREDAAARAAELRAEHDKAQEDLAAIIERHRELKKDYFERGDRIEEKAAEYDPDAPETASLFDLKQQRETVKQSTKSAKTRRVELEETIERTDRQAKEADAEAEEAAKKHHELKIKYFDARKEAEAAEAKFQVEEEARLKREAEQRAQREREEAAQRQRDAEAAAASQAAAPAGASAGASKPAAPASTSKETGKLFKKKDKKGTATAAPAAAGQSAAAAAEEERLKNVKLPPKSKLISLGDARSGPILAGYKTVQPKAEKHEEHAAEKKPAEEAKAETEAAAPEASSTTEVSKPDEDAAEEAEQAAEAKEEAEEKAEEKTQAEAEPEEPEAKPEAETADEVAEPVTEEATEAEPVENEGEKETETADAEISSHGAEDAASTNGVAPTSVHTSVGDETSREIHEDTNLKEKTFSEFGTGDSAEASNAAATEETAEDTNDEAAGATEVPGVAGAVATGPIEDVEKDIPLGQTEKSKATEETKDAFSEFDSSNVKETVEEKAPGLFKEDIQ